jgi:hypothetical protein
VLGSLLVVLVIVAMFTAAHFASPVVRPAMRRIDPAWFLLIGAAVLPLAAGADAGDAREHLVGPHVVHEFYLAVVQHLMHDTEHGVGAGGKGTGALIHDTWLLC